MSARRPATTFVWVRHGQARSPDDVYADDTPLSALGHAQAAAVPRGLGLPRPTALYASPLTRARQTAAPIAEATGLPIVLDPRIAEFDMASLTMADVASRPHLTLWRPADRGSPSGESSVEFHDRVAAYSAAMIARHPGERIIAVAHVGVIDAALRWVVGLAAEAPWLYELRCVGNGSITEFEHWPDGAVEGGAPRHSVIIRLGDAAHLGDMRTVT